MQIERVLAHASELGEPGFGDAPEAFDVVDVVVTSGEFIIAMVDTEVPVVSHIDETIVAFKPIGVNDTVTGHLAPDDGLQFGFGAVRHDLGIDPAMPFDETEYNGLAISAPATLAFNPACAEEGFVHFDLAG